MLFTSESSPPAPQVLLLMDGFVFSRRKIKFKPNSNLFLISHLHKKFNLGNAVKVMFTCPSRVSCHNRHISRVSASSVQIFPMAWSLFHTDLLSWFFMARVLGSRSSYTQGKGNKYRRVRPTCALCELFQCFCRSRKQRC